MRGEVASPLIEPKERREFMKLVEAIEILEKWYAGGYAIAIDDMNSAIKLSIEALKRLKFGRNHPSGWELEPLPGETSK